MAEQTPRGIPTPVITDPGQVPGYLQLLVSFLDPGPLQPYDPTAVATGRIVFLTSGDGEPQGTPTLGTIYVDRTTGRLWIPLTQVVQGADTVGWYRVGTDADAQLAELAGNIIGLVRTGLDTDAQVRAGTVALTLTGVAAGQTTQAWTATVTFPEPFTSVPVVVVSNGDTLAQPNVVVGKQQVTAEGFTVQVSRSDLPFNLNDQVTIDYIAYGS
jgi:hypothetical protein